MAMTFDPRSCTYNISQISTNVASLTALAQPIGLTSPLYVLASIANNETGQDHHLNIQNSPSFSILELIRPYSLDLWHWQLTNNWGWGQERVNRSVIELRASSAFAGEERNSAQFKSWRV